MPNCSLYTAAYFKITHLFKLLAASYFTLLLSLPATSQQVLTLEECIQLALKNNISVATANTNRELGSIALDQSRSQRMPQVNIDINQGINTGRSIDPFTNLYNDKATGFGNYSLSAEMLLFNGMQLSNTIKRNKALLSALDNETQTEKNVLIMQLIAAYISVITNTEIEKAIQVQLDNSIAQLEAGKVKVTAGVLGENQLSEFEALVAAQQLEKENARFVLEQSKLELFLLLNQRPDDKIIFSPLAINHNLPDADTLNAASIYQEAIKHFPDIKSVDQRKKSAEYDVLIAKGSRYPTLSFYSGVNSTYSSSAPAYRFEPDGTTSTVVNTSANNFVTVGGTDYYIKETQLQQNGTLKSFGFLNQLPFNRGFNFGVVLRIPIINGMQARYRVSTAKANLNLTRKQLGFVQTQLLSMINQAVLQYTNTQNRIRILTAQQKAFEQSVQNASVRLDAGIGSTLDYILIKTSQDRNMISLIQTKYEQAFRWKILNFYKTGSWE